MQICHEYVIDDSVMQNDQSFSINKIVSFDLIYKRKTFQKIFENQLEIHL